ncbi:MAG TPA: proton-conducting transporter membrane subunit [Acidimicrobiales bacterium]|nr:proton-conducting transporter membrane subunit [Acidimicrobiales bacterium]
MLALAVLAIPVLVAAVSGVIPWRHWIGWLGLAAIAAVLGCGVALAVRVVHGPPITVFGGVLRVDALSAFMVLVIGVIGVLATWQSVHYLDAEMAAGRCSRRHASLYAVLIQLFLAAMLLAVLANNLGILWVAIEATTIATAFLVGHRRTRGALEASWKYIVICSVGIAMAFLGTVLVYLASSHVGRHGLASLNWTALMVVSHHLDPGVMRLAMALLVLGYGTKVGLAPMHSWLPDAHSQAPAPVSALMSGVLLTVAFYALLRFKAIADAALGPAFPRALFVTVGLASLILATSLLLTQRDYKRMLAYHSVEHMGLIALGAAAGTSLAIAAVLLHILGHGLAKAVLFLASGEILLTEDTSDIAKVKALLARRPALGGIFGFGLVALLGLPPFSLFVSELNMVRAEVQVGLGWAAAISLVCMAVIFAAVMSHGRHLLLGSADGQAVHKTPGIVVVPLIGGLVGCAFLGVVAWPMQSLFHAAAHVVAL